MLPKPDAGSPRTSPKLLPYSLPLFPDFGKAMGQVVGNLDRIRHPYKISPNVNSQSTQTPPASTSSWDECFYFFEIGESLLAALFFYIFVPKE